jgi:hypothetical protein
MRTHRSSPGYYTSPDRLLYERVGRSDHIAVSTEQLLIAVASSMNRRRLTVA